MYLLQFDDLAEAAPRGADDGDVPAESAPRGADDVPAEAAPLGVDDGPAEAAPRGADDGPAESAPRGADDGPAVAVSRGVDDGPLLKLFHEVMMACPILLLLLLGLSQLCFCIWIVEAFITQIFIYEM